MVRRACCEKIGLKKGKWTAEEDDILSNYIHANGEGSWRCLPKNAGLLRCGKSCRLRWINYLKSGIKRGNFTIEEETTIVKLHRSLGNRWSEIAAHLSGRTDNELKNYWNSHLRRKIYCFRNTYNEMITNATNLTNSTSKKKSRDQLRCSIAEKRVRGFAPTAKETQSGHHERRDRTHSVPLHQNDERYEKRGDNGEPAGSSLINETTGVVFPGFEEEIESVVWDWESGIGNLSPVIDKWANWDLGCEGYFDQGLEELQVEGEKAWPWLWDENELNYPIM